MQGWVEDRFSSITNHNLQGKKVEVSIVGELSTGVQVHVEPIKEVRKLILTFPMPSMDEHYGVKPLSFFAHLLGYEGEGSLMMQLKEKGWITSLSRWRRKWQQLSWFHSQLFIDHRRFNQNR